MLTSGTGDSILTLIFLCTGVYFCIAISTSGTGVSIFTSIS